MKPTSEQELKQLLNEGKISEEEYGQLLEAMKPKGCTDKQTNQPKYNQNQGVYVAILLSILTVFMLGMFYILRRLPIDFSIGQFGRGIILASSINAGYLALFQWVALWKHGDTIFLNRWTNKENYLIRTSFIMMTTGVVLPAVIYLACKFSSCLASTSQYFALGLAVQFELIALFCGISSGENRRGKTAAIISGILFGLLSIPAFFVMFS